MFCCFASWPFEGKAMSPTDAASLGGCEADGAGAVWANTCAAKIAHSPGVNAWEIFMSPFYCRRAALDIGPRADSDDGGTRECGDREAKQGAAGRQVLRPDAAAVRRDHGTRDRQAHAH